MEKLSKLLQWPEVLITVGITITVFSLIYMLFSFRKTKNDFKEELNEDSSSKYNDFNSIIYADNSIEEDPEDFEYYNDVEKKSKLEDNIIKEPKTEIKTYEVDDIDFDVDTPRYNIKIGDIDSNSNSTVNNTIKPEDASKAVEEKKPKDNVELL